MANFNLNVNASPFVKTQFYSNGAIITGPDYPRGKMILTDGIKFATFEKKVKDLAEEQLAKSKKIAEEAIKGLDKQYKEGVSNFNDQLKEELQQLKRSQEANESTES